MKFKIRPIQQDDFKKSHEFQCRYLDEENYGAFLKRVKENPDLYFGAFDGDKLIGICYGHPSKNVKSAMNLQGIAVNHNKTYLRKGIGSKLMRKFEKTAKEKGKKRISLGSSDDRKVEKFYLKHRYKPFELVAKGQNHKELERIKVDDYEAGRLKQKELRKKHNPKEVIFIFEKSI